MFIHDAIYLSSDFAERGLTNCQEVLHAREAKPRCRRMDPTQQQTHSPSLQHALQQQQTPIQQQAPVQVAQQATAQSTTIDNLTCQWQGCGERCESPEALYVSINHSQQHTLHRVPNQDTTLTRDRTTSASAMSGARAPTTSTSPVSGARVARRPSSATTSPHTYAFTYRSSRTNATSVARLSSGRKT